MSNPFYYLFGLLLVFAYPTGLEPLAFVRPAAHPEMLAPAAAIVAALLYAALVVSVHRAILRRNRLGVLGRARMLLRFAALILFAILIYVFHFPLQVWALTGRSVLLLETLGALVPLFFFFGILSFFSARFDALHRSGASRGVLTFAFRSFAALSLLPVLAMLGLYTAFESIEPLWRLAYVYPFAGWGVVVVWIVLLLGFLPLLLRLAFGARPMPPGPLRARLEAVCRRIGFRSSELLVVETGPVRMANAFIVGLGVPWRYVFFTDALLAGMTEEELECVLAHEIVHSKKRHMLFYLFFTVGFTLAAALGYEFLTGLPEPLTAFILLAWGALYWIGAFGYVSRRFETEADLFAARWIPGPEGASEPYGSARAMAAALDRVAALNRMPVTGWSWRHFNISTRMAILLGAESDPAIGYAYERQCRLLRTAAVALLLMGMTAGVGLAIQQSDQAGAARARLAAYDRIEAGQRFAQKKQYPEAVAELRAGLSAGAAEPRFWLLLADCERQLGREAAARDAERRAREGGVIHPELRLKLEEGADSP